MAPEKLRRNFDYYLGRAEVVVYSVLAILLCITILAVVGSSTNLLWHALKNWTVAKEALPVLDELFVVLMLVEILHTVRISIRSHVLVAEPFLIVGLIASIRRMFMISLQMATHPEEASGANHGGEMFRSSMIELGLLGILVLILVFSITLVRKSSPPSEVEWRQELNP